MSSGWAYVGGASHNGKQNWYPDKAKIVVSVSKVANSVHNLLCLARADATFYRVLN